MSLPAYVSRNGAMIRPKEARISVFNPAIYGAYGVYESMQVNGGVVFALQPHLQRLARSAALLDLPLPAGAQILERWIADVLAANGARDCTLRFFVLGAENGGEVIAYLWPQPPTIFPAGIFSEGAPVITFEGHRYLPECKSLNNLASTLARRAADAAGAHEALLHHDGHLTEGANSNLFAVQDGIVLTPPAGQVLSGVTRNVVMGLAGQAGIPLIEAVLPRSQVATWSECFITSTGRHVMPVTHIDGHPVHNGQVGPITQRLRDLFEACYAQATGGF